MERKHTEHYERKISKKDNIIKKYIIQVIKTGDITQQTHFIRIYPIFRCNISLFELWMEIYTKDCKSYPVDTIRRNNTIQFITTGIDIGSIILNKRDINRLLNIFIINKEKHDITNYIKQIKINMTKSDSYSNLTTGNILKTSISDLKIISGELSSDSNTDSSKFAFSSNSKTLSKHNSDSKIETFDNMQLTPVIKRKIKYNNFSLPNIIIKKAVVEDNEEMEVYNKYLKTLNILKVYDAKDIVHELTNKWYKCYNKITFDELVDSVINTGQTSYHPHVAKLNEWFKKINFWIPNEILKNPIKKDQYKFIEAVIKIAKIAKKTHNYLLFMAVYLGLQNNSIQRLHFLWEKDKIKKEMMKFTNFWDSKKNYDHYRNTVNNLAYGTICIPYMILFKQDLIHLLEIPTIMNNKINEDLVLSSIKLCKNLKKFQINDMINSINNSSNSDENPQKNNIIKYFDLIKPLTDDRNDKLFKLSRAIFKLDNNLTGRKRSVTGSIFDMRNYDKPNLTMSYSNIMDTITKEFSPFNASSSNSVTSDIINSANDNNSNDSNLPPIISLPNKATSTDNDLDKTVEVSAELASSSGEQLKTCDTSSNKSSSGETLNRNLRLVRTASDFFKKIKPTTKHNNNIKTSNRSLKRVKTLS